MIHHNAGWSSLVARRAHNPKVVGSNPTPATNYGRFSRLRAYAEAADQHVWSAVSVFMGTVCGDLLSLAYAAHAEWRGRERPARCGFAVEVGSGEALHRHALYMPTHLPYSTSPSRPKRFGGTVVAVGKSRMAMSMALRIPDPEAGAARAPVGKTDARRRFIAGARYSR